MQYSIFHNKPYQTEGPEDIVEDSFTALGKFGNTDTERIKVLNVETLHAAAS